MVAVLEFLSTKLNILHRDISPNNILLFCEANTKVRCLLTDFDYAVTMSEVPSQQQVSHGFRTVSFFSPCFAMIIKH